MTAVISTAVEGPTDAVVAQRLITHTGATPGPVHGMRGKGHLRESIRAYNNAARHAPWLVLADLDREADCPPPLRQAWLADPGPLLCLRFAVRAIEAWLLADVEAIAAFLRVKRRSIPNDPEALPDPKETLVGLARIARDRAVRADMVPRQGSGRRTGPAYSSRVIEFVSEHWRPEIAATRADSLARALRCLRRLAEATA